MAYDGRRLLDNREKNPYDGARLQREEGVSRKDDIMPKRLTTEKLPAGPKKGAVFTEEDTKKMQDDSTAQ